MSWLDEIIDNIYYEGASDSHAPTGVSKEHRRAILKHISEAIGEDENSGTYEQSSGTSGLSVMDTYRNELRAELREKLL